MVQAGGEFGSLTSLVDVEPKSYLVWCKYG